MCLLADSLLPAEKADSQEDDLIVYKVKRNSSLMGNSASSSLEPLPLGKRPRTTNLHSQVLLCQVYGCNKDLRSSKDYHKRHKVCDEHSKTTKVIVNGFEQRFCQQCSRYGLACHLLLLLCCKTSLGWNTLMTLSFISDHLTKHGITTFDNADS